LRIGRASDFYPKEIPNCIARPDVAVPSGSGTAGYGKNGDVNGERANKRAKLDEDVDMDSEENGTKEADDLVSVTGR
jgi:actin-related protein 8